MPSSFAKGRGFIAAQGYPLILAGVVLILLGVMGGWPWLTGLGVVAGGFFAYFFRDPERDIPPEPGVIVSPADGMVVRVDEVQENEFLKAPARYVAIFMNVFDVHVNRSPVAARGQGNAPPAGGVQGGVPGGRGQPQRTAGPRAGK